VVAFVTPPPQGSVTLPTAVDLEELYDFHSMIASLGDYPKLMRMLGLVVDLRIDVSAGAPAATGTVKVEPAIPFTMTAAVATPRTHYRLDDASFLATPRPDDPSIGNGLLLLNDTAQFRVIQVDVVGGAVKLQNTATSMVLVSDQTKRAPNMPDN